jgi:capsular polysaccharide biosynthesis protein
MESQKMTSVSIIEPATVPSKPANAPLPFGLCLGIAIFAGLGCGLGLAFLLDAMDQSIITPQQVEKLTGLQVLTAIPYKNILSSSRAE